MSAAEAASIATSASSLVRAAAAAVSFDQVIALAAAIRKNEERLRLEMPVKRIALAGDVTMDGIAAAAAVALAGEGLVASNYVAPFGSYRQEILDGDSELYATRPELAIIAPHLDLPLLGEPDIADWVEDHVGTIEALWSAFAERCPGVHIIHHLYEMPHNDLLGVAERQVAWTPLRLAQQVNALFVERAPKHVHLVDIDRLAARVGRDNWGDQRLWFHGKIPFALKYLGEYKVVLAAAIRRALGSMPKALVMDLDNTLWRGVVGDDGVDGIGLGPETAAGEAHLAFCRYVQSLGRRGVILAICSKNSPEIVAPVFEEHPHMPLRLDDFASVQCNWDDKASNLRRVSAELNVDPSAMVFVDDNEAECELIRRELPMVRVVPLIGDPAFFCRRLDSLRLFDSDGLSNEDFARQASYRGRRQAAAARTSANSLAKYLQSLEMSGSLWRARDEDLTRLAQMEGKTNQFNLTTRRWSADQLKTFINSDEYDVLCFKLADRFADHGLVSSVVIRYSGPEGRIVSWLMSCRVFSRGAEEFILNEILKCVESRGATVIMGEYFPTPKNGVVADLYPRLGFIGSQGLYELAVRPEAKRQTFIRSE